MHVVWAHHSRNAHKLTSGIITIQLNNNDTWVLIHLHISGLAVNISTAQSYFHKIYRLHHACEIFISLHITCSSRDKAQNKVSVTPRLYITQLYGNSDTAGVTPNLLLFDQMIKNTIFFFAFVCKTIVSSEYLISPRVPGFSSCEHWIYS